MILSLEARRAYIYFGGVHDWEVRVGRFGFGPADDPTDAELEEGFEARAGVVAAVLDATDPADPHRARHIIDALDNFDEGYAPDGTVLP